MEKLKAKFCRYDMVCDNPKIGSVEVIPLPEFYYTKSEIEIAQTHVHTFYEIVWFLEGEGSHTVDFTEYPITPNTFFFIAPGQLHSFTRNNSQKGVVMKICNHLLEEELSAEGILMKYNLFSNYDSVPFKKTSPESVPLIEAIVRQIEAETKNADSIGHHDYLQSLVKILLIQIERCQIGRDDTIFSVTRTAHRTFLAFRREIERNYRTKHTVKEYADLLNISTKTLNNYISECSSFSPLEMINNRIILEAKRLLRYSNMMIKEIAFELGFDEPS